LTKSSEINLKKLDLKPENLLLSSDDENAIIKLSDFGFAKEKNHDGLKSVW
jgi:serine/threonine protein kinase